MDPNQDQSQPPDQPPQPPLPPQQPYVPHQENPGQTFGIVSIIMIFVFPLLGIIFGAISRSKSKAANMPTGLGTAGLIINIVLTVLGFLAFILFFVLVVMAANSPSVNTQDDSSSSGSSGNSSHVAIKATGASDFDEVCDGTPISNAAPLTTKQSALMTTFYQRPDSGSSSWTSTFVGFRKPYYLEDRQNFASVSVVACAKGTQTGTPAHQCAYESKTIDYFGARYDVTFYEAKTAKKLGGGTFEETNTSCPSFVSYNTQTNSAVATPTDDKYEAVIDSFVTQ